MPEHEVTMARSALRAGAALVLPVVGLAYLVRGPAGGLTALGALALVLGNAYLTGRTFAWAGRRSPTLLQAVALGGFFVKISVLAAALVLLRPVEAIDGPVLAVSTVVVTIVTLAVEVRYALAHAELWWLRPTGDGTGDGRGRA